MFKISIDNPFLFPILMLVIGLIGFIYIQVSNEMFNYFSFLFLFLSLLLLIAYIKFSSVIDNRNIWNIRPINTLFSVTVLAIKVYLLLLLILSGGSGNFDDRLVVYGSSFLLGLSLAVDIFLFPIIPIFAKNQFLRSFSFYLYFISFFITMILAPSKSLFIGLIFSLLTYRFLKRKTGSSLRRVKLVSFKSFLIFTAMFSLTLVLLYARSGEEFLDLLLHRVSMNYDNAIYASSIIFDKYPDKDFLFYSLLPILKKFNPELYSLEFFSTSQWILYEVLNIERYNRYGYPNDNYIVGIILSYKNFSVAIFLVTISITYLFIKRLVKKKSISSFEIFLLLSIPSFFASTQDLLIKLYVVLPLYLFFSFLYLILPKQGASDDN